MPRQVLFLANYLDPSSPTFSIIKASGIKAGFGKRYSEKLVTLMPDWLNDRMQNNSMVAKAEKRLDEALDIDVRNVRLGERPLKTAMFVVERLNKKRWAQKAEETERPPQINAGIKNTIERIYGNH